MPTRFLAALRRSLTRGPALVVVPALVAGTLVSAQSRPVPRTDRPSLTKTSTPPGGGEFVPLTPSRVLDTRSPSAPLSATGTRTIPLLGAGGVPTTGVSAVVVVVTAVTPTATGYLTVYPYGMPSRPVLSHVYFNSGENAANTVIAKLGTDGKVVVYNHAGTTHLLVDVTGYYTSSSTTTAGGTFVPLSPARIYSTPDGLNTGTAGTASYGAAETRSVQVTGQGGVPAGAEAVALNVTGTTTTTTSSYLQVWQDGIARPTSSNVQLAGNDSQRGLAVVKLSDSGKIQVYNNAGSTQVKLDVEGYYLPATSDAAKIYVPVTPARVYSTTLGLNTPGGSTAKLGAGASLSVPIRGATDAGGNVVVPDVTSVEAVVASIGTGSPTATSYMTAWPTGETRPDTSMSAYSANENREATFFGKLGTNGKIDVYNNAGTVSVSVEIQGYFQTPDIPPPAAPTNLAGIGRDGRVDLSWTAAADNGWALTGNTIVVTTVAGATVATYEESAGTVAKSVTGLTNGQPYVFTVTARNGGGPGPSVSVQVAPVAPPSAPANVVATPGNRSLAVTWQAADGNGAAISGQTVTIRKASDDSQAVQAMVAADATSRTFTGLTNGTAYYAEVVATSQAGTGAVGTSAPATPVFSGTSPYATEVVADEPAAYYRLGEPAGPSATDLSGFERTGTYLKNPLFGRPGAIVGDPDTAVSFDLADGVKYAPATSLPSGNAPRSVETWLKTTSDGLQTIGGWGSDETHQRFYLWMRGDSLYIERYGVKIEHHLPNQLYNTGWHHVVLTYSGGPDNRSVLYVDGHAVSTVDTPDGLNTVASGSGLTIGREPNSDTNEFVGSLDEFAVYDKVLPADRVLAHFRTSGRTLPLPPQNVAVTSGQEHVTVTWDPTTAVVPADVPAVDSYVVEATSNGVLRGRIRTAAGTTSARISGLPAGDYVVTVHACNRYGCGDEGVDIGTVTGAAATYASLVLDDAPLAYLRLGERTGSVVADSSPHRRDATVNASGVLGVNGAVGGDPDPAMKGGGTGNLSLARTTASGFAPTGTAARSLHGWVKGNGALAGWGTAATGKAFGIRVTGDAFVVSSYGNDVTFTTPVSVADGAWHHVAATFDGTTVTAYFDGAVLGAQQFPVAIDTAASQLVVGILPGDTTPRTAPVDDVAVLGTVLSPDRIQTYFGAATLHARVAIDPSVRMAAPKVTTGAGTATVTWAPPSDTAGVEAYEVTALNRAEGSEHEVRPLPGGATSTTFDGLRTGASYVFSVRLRNNLGWSPMSPQASATILPPLATLPKGVNGPTYPPERVSVDRTWGPAGSPYVVNDLYVDPGATLTLLPGTIVKATGQIVVKGQIVAAGTPDKPVVFTSHNDDSVGGDTNGDGPSSGAINTWGWMEFNLYGQLSPPVSVLDHVEIRYGRGGGSPTFHDGVVETDGFAKVVISNSRFHANAGAIGTRSSDPSGRGWTSIVHNLFTDNHYGVRPMLRTDIIGNVFAAVDVPNDEAAAIRMQGSGTDVRIAYNDLYMPFAHLDHDSGGTRVVVTANNFWTQFGYDYAYPSLAGNYWGRPIGDAPACTTLDGDDTGHPRLDRSSTSGGPCPSDEYEVFGYTYDVLPALQAPITTYEAEAGSETQVPTSGPVDTANGVLRYDVTDLELNDAGQAMNVRRSYRSDKGSSILGKGWYTNYSATMSTAPNGTRSVDFASGASARFQTTGQAEPGINASMTTSSTGASVTASDNSSYSFDLDGLLTSMTLRDPDHKVELTRTDGDVTAVVGVSGRRFTLAYDAGKLATISDSSGRDVAYTVTGDRLTAARRAGGGSETYDYDADGRLTSVRTPLGRYLLKVGYDAEGRVDWYEQAGAGRTTIEYHPAERYTIVHQPDGVDIRQEYDRLDRLIRQMVVGGRTVHVAIGVGSVPQAVVNGLPSEGASLAPEVTATRLDFRGNPVEQVDGVGRVVLTSFDGQGRPLATTYADGGTVTRHYDAKGRVDYVDDPRSKRWLAEYDAFGQVTTVTDPLLRTRRSVYHSNGDLFEQYDTAGKKTTFETDPVGRVVAVTDPLGKTARTSYTEWNRVRTRTSPRGGVTTTTFDEDRNPLTTSAPLARTATLTYDGFGRVGTMKDAEGNVTTVTYDVMSRVEEVLAPNGGTLVRTFTADGDLETTTDALLRTTTYEYDNLGNVAKIIDPTNVATVLTYDHSGKLLTRKIGQQNAEVRTYDGKGRPATVKSERGGVVTTTYDTFDRPVSVTDSVRGVLLTRTYDDAGRLETETNALGNTTTFGYDTADRVTSADDEIGRLFLRTFDDAANLLTDQDGIGFKVVRTYDDDGNVATERNAGDGGLTTYETDLAGRVTAVVDPIGRRTETDYDKLDRVVERRTGTAGRLTESFSYDAAGNTLTHTDRAGTLWQWDYDLAGQLTKATSPTGAETTYDYDGAGRPKQTTDPDGVVTNTEYDASGRPFRTTDGAGAAWVTTYDVDARPVKTTDPDGVSLTNGYDAAGRVVTTKDGANHVTTTTYDAADNVLTVKDPLLHVTTAEYDGRGRRTATVDPLGGRRTYTWNLANQPTGMSDDDGFVSVLGYGLDGRLSFYSDEDARRFVTTYDLAGQLEELHLPWHPTTPVGEWRWTYDDVGNVESEDVGGVTTAYEYDGEGRVTKVTKGSGRVTTITRDGEGRVLTESAVNPVTSETGLRSRTYTPAGRLKTALSAEGLSEWAYDTLGQLKDSVTPAGTSATTYTPAHRVKTTSVNGRATTTATYNTRGLLESLAGPIGQTYTYDNAQRLTKIKHSAPETGVETFAWDDADRLTLHEQKASETATTAQLSEAYEYTLGGRVERETHAAPSKGVAWDKTFGYDTLGRLTGLTTTAVDGTKTVQMYGYDSWGNRSYDGTFAVSTTGETTPVSAVTYSHDVAGRIATSGFAYDVDGNLLSSPEGSFSYDAFGDLASVSNTTGSGTAEATYGRDGLGRMVRRTEGAVTTSFTYDGTSLDIAEQQTGADVASYVREPGGALAGVVAGGAVSHVVRNRHTDVVGLVGVSSGALSAYAVYEPYGERSGDTAALPLGYQSDFTDPITGSVDMGARAYLPSLGRFAQLDSVVGDVTNPASFNRFLYGVGDPLSSVDPDGHWPDFIDKAVDWAADTGGALVETVWDTGRVMVATLSGNEEARDNALADLEESGGRLRDQMVTGLKTVYDKVVKPVVQAAADVVRPAANYLRRNAIARTLVTIGVGLAATGLCTVATGGAGAAGCFALGAGITSGLDSLLTCEPPMSGGECAMAGFIEGFATGLAGGALSKVIPGASSLLGKVTRGAFIGGASMAAGSAASQYAMTGTVDGGEVLRAGGVGALFGGGASGAGHAWSAAKRRGTALAGRFRTARATGDLGAIRLPWGRSPTASATLRLPASQSWARPETLDDHFVRHGADFGAKTADEYAGMASDFFQRGLSSGLPTKIDSKTGVIRIYDRATNTFGSFNASGATKTFYKPDPAQHGFAVNWDYWVSQSGHSL